MKKNILIILITAICFIEALCCLDGFGAGMDGLSDYGHKKGVETLAEYLPAFVTTPLFLLPS